MIAILAHDGAVRIYDPGVIPAGIPAILLAAGKSTRMGRSKALLPLGPGETAETFLTHLIATFHAAEIDDVVVVVGYEAAAIVDALQRCGTDARVVVNEDYEAGQLTSLLAGLRVVDHPGVVAALVTLVDVPLVAASTVRALVQRYRETRAPIVRPVRGARHGHPVLIDRTLFDPLRAVDPSQGANVIIRAHASAAGDVEVTDEGAFADVDTPAEYEALIASCRSALE
jgi:molybdenum cofactor cytidylyltransferase